MDLNQAAMWLISGDGRLACAGALFVLVWALKSVPVVRERILTTPSRKKVAVVLIAAIPAAAGLLATSAPVSQVLVTFVTAVIGAMGLHSASKKNYAAEEESAPSQGDANDDGDDDSDDEGEEQ